MTKEEFAKRDLIQTALIVGVMFFIFSIIKVDEIARNSYPIERQWLDEETVCYTQNGKIINCETLWSIE